MSLRVSLTNYLAASATVITAVSEASGYPVENVATAANPFTPYNSLVAGAGQIITWNYGAPMPVEVWGFGRLNFTSLTIQADDAPTFNSAAGSPQFSQAITAAEALNSRIHGSYRPPAPVSRQYNRMIIANQTTIATAPTTKYTDAAALYLVGFIWAGPLATVPRDILMEPELERQEPTDDVTLPSGGRSRSRMGYPYVTLGAKWLAEDAAASTLDVQLRAWMALFRAWGESDVALVLPRDLVPSDAYVMRRVKGPAVTWGRIWSQGDLTLEEVAN